MSKRRAGAAMANDDQGNGFIWWNAEPLTVKGAGNIVSIGGHLITWGGPNARDLEAQYFTPRVLLGPHRGNGEMVVVNHRRLIGKGMEPLTEWILPPMTVTEDELGMYAEVLLDTRERYAEWTAEQSAKGLLCWSSGSAPHMVRVLCDDGTVWKGSGPPPPGEIMQWPVIEGSLTPMPVESAPTNRVLPVKGFDEYATKSFDPLREYVMKAAATAPANGAARRAPAKSTETKVTEKSVTKTGGTDLVLVGATGPMKSLPWFQVVAVKSVYFGDYLEQGMTCDALQVLGWALNCRVQDALYGRGGEPDPSDIAELPAIYAEYAEIAMATIMALMGVQIAEEVSEEAGDAAEDAPGGEVAAAGETVVAADPMMTGKSALYIAVDRAVKASQVLSATNAADLAAALEHHTKGMEMIQGVLDRHEEKSAAGDTTKGVSALRRELARANRENEALKAAKAAPVAATATAGPRLVTIEEFLKRSLADAATT